MPSFSLPPLTWGATGLVAGAFVGLGVALAWPWMSGLGALLSIGAVTATPQRRVLALVAGLFGLGVMVGLSDGGRVQNRLNTLLRSSGAGQVALTGVIRDTWLSTMGQPRARLLVQGAGSIPGLVGGTVVLTGNEKQILRFSIGSTWRLKGRYAPPGPPQGLSFFSPRFHGAVRGEMGWLKVTNAKALVAQPPATARLWRWQKNIEQRLLSAYGPDTAALLAGLVLGRRMPGTEALAEDLRSSGALHLLVVSGAHLALLMGAVAWGLRSAKVGYRRRLMAMAAALLVYGVMAGGVALFRALCMSALVLGGRFAGWGVRPAVALSVAVVVLVAADAAVLLVPGFWLSVAATAGVLVGLATRAAAAAEPPWLGKVNLTLWCGAWATALTLPLLAGFFGQAAPLSPLSTLMLLPLLSALLVLGLFTVAVGVWLPGLREALGFVIGGLHRMTEALAGVLAQAPGAVWSVNLTEGAALGAALCLLLWVWWLKKQSQEEPASETPAPARPEPFWRTWRARPPLAPLAVLLMGAVALWPAFVSPPPLMVDFLNVGQGDATLFTGPQTGVVLVDGGPWPVALPPGRAPVVEALRQRGVRRVDLLVATHADADHLGGVVAVLRSMPVGRVVWPAADSRFQKADSDTLRQFASLTADKKMWRVKTGDTLRAGPLALSVLAPARRGSCQRNICALVMEADMGRLRLLLSSDHPMNDTALLQENLAARLRPVHLAHVPHHGGAHDSGGLLWWRTRPAVVHLSVGAFNPYGHPAPGTLQGLEFFHLPWFASHRHGTVTLYGDPWRKMQMQTRP